MYSHIRLLIDVTIHKMQSMKDEHAPLIFSKDAM